MFEPGTFEYGLKTGFKEANASTVISLITAMTVPDLLPSSIHSGISAHEISSPVIALNRME